MASLVTPVSGDLATAELIAQLTELLGGLRNIPVSLTGINDASAYALTLKNAGTGSKGQIVYAADGTTVLLQVGGSGVLVSPDGVAAAAPAVTVSGVQTLTNKTLTSPALTSPVITGAGFSVWTAFTPGLIQNAGLTLSVATGRYTQFGKTVCGSINITINSVGLSGSPFNLTGLPVAGQVNGSPAWGWYTRTGGTVYPMTAIWNTTTSIEFFGGNGTGVLGTNPAFAAAAGDTIAVNFMYEAA